MLAAVLEFGLWHSWSTSPVSARRGRKLRGKDLRLLGEANFIERDLSQRITIDSKYDLACCLEVAEHLPPERAGSFVEDLTKLAPVVLFSAAIPGQGGDNHVNEMWQHHWARLFAKNGFRAVDYVRPMIWSMVGCKLAIARTYSYTYMTIF